MNVITVQIPFNSTFSILKCELSNIPIMIISDASMIHVLKLKAPRYSIRSVCRLLSIDVFNEQSYGVVTVGYSSSRECSDNIAPLEL